jgi:hypothetical protein
MERFLARFSTVFHPSQSHKSLARTDKKFSRIPDMRKKVERFCAQKGARSKTLVHQATVLTLPSESVKSARAGLLKWPKHAHGPERQESQRDIRPQLATEAKNR